MSSDKESCMPPHELDLFDFSFLPRWEQMVAVVADSHAWGGGEFGEELDGEAFAPELINVSRKAHHNYYLVKTRKAYDQISQSGADFMLHLGDICTWWPWVPQWQKESRMAKRLLGRLGMPSHLVPGNHDIGNMPQIDAGAKNPVSAESVATYRQAFGDPFYSFEAKGSLFVVICDAIMNSGLPIEEKQWVWLEELLRESQGKYKNIITAHHHLIYWNTTDDLGCTYDVMANPARERLLGLYSKYEVRADLSGHTHWETLNQHGDTWMFTAGSPAFTRNGSFNFLPKIPSGHDPGKMVYYLLRISGTNLALNAVRIVDLLPPARSRQIDNPNPLRRLMPLQLTDRRPGPFAVTVPVWWEKPSFGHPRHVTDGITKPLYKNPKFDDRNSWQSARKHTGDEWLQVTFRRTETVNRIVIHPGQEGFPVPFRVETSVNGTDWQQVGASAPTSDHLPVTVTFEPREVRHVRFAATREKDAPPLLIREMAVLNPEGVNVAHQTRNPQVTCSSWKKQRVMTKNTMTTTLALDLNPALIRIDPGATSWPALAPDDGILHLDRMVEETVAYLVAQGADVSVSISTENPVCPNGIDAPEFEAYCKLLVERLPGVAAWEIRGGTDAFKEAAAVLTRHAKDSRITWNPDDRRILVQPEEDDFAIVPLPSRPAARQEEPAKDLMREIWSNIKDRREMACLSICPDSGLLDEYDNPMYAFYAARSLATVLGDFSPRGRPVAPVDGVDMQAYATPTGTVLLLLADNPREVDLQLTEATEGALLVDPLTSTTQELVVNGKQIAGVRLPDYPVAIRLRD
jgi:hypothetical protein